MKKLIAIIMAIVMGVSMMVLPASAAEQEYYDDILDQQFQGVLTSLDYGYELDEYRVIKTNRIIFEEKMEEPWNYEGALTVSAEEYETVLNRFFVVTPDELAQLRAEGYAGFLTYNQADATYSVTYPGGFGGALSERVYMGYVTTDDGYDVFYGKANYAFLQDALPEGTSEYDYADSLGNPSEIEYQGKVYEAGPDGYYYLESVEKTGKKYTVVLDNEIVRIKSCVVFEEAECPEEFEKLPAMDEDLLSIMGDIRALVEKYGPEIPEEVKNGTEEGTKSDYEVGENSYYVAIGDDTAWDEGSYVSLLADQLGVGYKNLAQKGQLIDEANAEFLAANEAEIKKADLITLGFSINGFGTVAVEEVLKDRSEDESYLDWSRYLPEEGVAEVEAVLERMRTYLLNNNLTEDLPVADISTSDALVVAAESFAYGTLSFTIELPKLVDAIRAINPTAEIIIVGMDNPMEGSSIVIDEEAEDADKMELGIYVDQLIQNMDDTAQTVALENENVVFVSAPNAANENDNQELPAAALLLSYIGNVKAAAKPNAAGQAYIMGRIMVAMGVKGDYNGDGFVDYMDAVAVLRAGVGLSIPTAAQIANCDFNGDNQLDYLDAIQILRISVGLA